MSSSHRKLDPLLHMHLDAAPLVLGEASDTTTRLSMLIDFAGSRSELEALGVTVESFADGIATGSVLSTQLSTLVSDPRVRSIEAARPLGQELDLSAPAIGADVVQRPPLQLSGRGVIIGVIDTGIDLWHPAFRRADGRSAVIELWDQTLAPVAGEQHPEGFGYGVVYNQTQISEALAAGRTTTLLRHRDRHGHGTHVASIAAGSALPHQGIAPAAELIVVATASDAKALGDSARTLDAIRYVYARATALGKPAVINLSLGSYLGPHDGTSLLERGIDALLAAPGRALIKAAGNAGGAGCHASGTLKRGQSVALPIDVAGGADATIDVWYAAAGRFEVSISSPDGTEIGPIAGDEVRELFLPNGNQVSISSILDNPTNNDNRIYIVLNAGGRGTLAAGRWTITLHAKQRRNAARFDAWIERGSTPPRFTAAAADERMTVSVPGTAHRCIAVAAFADHTASHAPDPQRPLLAFSSRGPTRDNRTQPVLAAPGGWIAAARSADTNRTAFGDARWTLLSGTSMAAPHVAGAVALLFERQPELSAEQVRERLSAAAQPQTDTDGWGAGAIDLRRLFATIPVNGMTENAPAVRSIHADDIPRYAIAAGTGRWYAVEIAAESALFAATTQRRYVDETTNGNFFASWREQPLLDGSIYTLPERALSLIRAVPQAQIRLLTSATPDRWSDVRRSAPDRAMPTTTVTSPPAPNVPATNGLLVESLPEGEHERTATVSNTKNNTESKPAGAPPADMEIAEVDTTAGAIAVHAGQTDLAARAIGLPATTEDVVTADNITSQALPSAAYGTFVRRVGLAVAAAQSSLDDNSVEAAQKLAAVKVPALIAMNEVVNEKGELISVDPVVQEVSLIQYIQPTFYQFRTVQMFARFDVTSFDSSGETNISSSISGSNSANSRSGSSGSVGASFLGIPLGGGSVGGNSSSSSNSGFTRDSETNISSDFESARSSGTSYMYAELRPRTDTRFPPPLLVRQGPELSIRPDKTSLNVADDVATLTISLTGKGISLNQTSRVEVSLEGPGTLSATGSITLTNAADGNGRTGTLTLTRSAADAVGTAVIRIKLGIMNASASIRFPALPPA